MTADPQGWAGCRQAEGEGGVQGAGAAGEAQPGIGDVGGRGSRERPLQAEQQGGNVPSESSGSQDVARLGRASPEAANAAGGHTSTGKRS